MASLIAHYLSLKEVAERIGLTPGTLSRYTLPEPDAMIGDVRGWLPLTIDAWDRERRRRRATTPPCGTPGKLCDVCLAERKRAQ